MTTDGKPVSLSDEELELVVGGSGPPVTGITPAGFQGMDLESAMMAVQSQRANVLESQLKGQMEAVQARNDNINKMTQALGGVNALSALFNSNAKPGDTISTTPKAGQQSIDQLLEAAGLSSLGKHPTTITKAEADTLTTQLKSRIDSQSDSQQMDMLRLQSLSNKRNEAFDLMTNFVKKMADARTSIVGNMR